jgi:hypothetical protein
LSAAALFLSATFFSCDKDNHLPDNPTTGEEVFIQIRTLEIAESNEDDLSRAASLQDSEPEYTPTGDGLFVNMSMEENGEESLRAEKDLITGAYFRVIAVKTGTSEYVSHGDFRQGGSPTVSTFTVPSNATYDFICLSYNNTTNTLPASFAPTRGDDISTETLSGDLENLLWQKKTYPVGNTDPSLSFLLNYMAARVRVVVDCEYNEWIITGIANSMQLSSVALVQSVNLMDGGLIGGSTETKTVTWPTLIEDTEQTSNPFIVVPTASNVTLTVTIPVNVVTRKYPLLPIPTVAGYTGTFSAKLQVGHSYNLFVKLKAPKFAGSNIYWDGDLSSGKLTFDLYGETDNQGYQGVFFRWGSLVGISPTAVPSTSTRIYLASSTLTYSYDLINYWNHGVYGTVIYHHADRIAEYRGDICRYLGTVHTKLAGYRLPVQGEFGSGGGPNAFSTMVPVGGWLKGSGTFQTSNGAGNAYGRADLLDASKNNASKVLGSAYNRTMNITFPAAGAGTASELIGIGNNGAYWSSSMGSTFYIAYLAFSGEGAIYTAGGAIDSYIFPVRCVKIN